MNCEVVQERLGAFADGELRGISAWSIRRHLGKCDTCQRELAELRQIDALLRTADIAANLPPIVTLPSRTLYKTAQRWTVTAALAAALVGVALLLGPALFHSKKSIAFADVERAMDDVRTMQYVRVVTIYDADTGKPRSKWVTDIFFRVDSPAIAERDRARESYNSGIINSIQDVHGTRKYLPSTNDLIIDDRPPERFVKQAAGKSQRFVAVPCVTEKEFAQVIKRFLHPDLSKSKVWNIRRGILDGRDVLIFTPQAEIGSRITLWVDPVTHRYLRAENQTINLRTGKTDSILIDRDYQYDMTLPAEVFRLDVPPNARVSHQK